MSNDRMCAMPRKDQVRMKRQRGSLVGSKLSQTHIERHRADIAEALVMIHFERETPAYRFETRRMLERWLADQGADTAEGLDEWYGIVLAGGEDERLTGWMHVKRAVEREVAHSVLRSLGRAVERTVPLASSQ